MSEFTKAKKALSAVYSMQVNRTGEHKLSLEEIIGVEAVVTLYEALRIAEALEGEPSDGVISAGFDSVLDDGLKMNLYTNNVVDLHKAMAKQLIKECNDE